MKFRNYTGIPLYYIDYFYPKTGKLADISEEGYKTLELCQAQIQVEKDQDEEFKQDLFVQYEEDLKNFVLDLDTSDRPPVHPSRLSLHYIRTPHQYIRDEHGYHEVTEHCIKDLNSINASNEQIQAVNLILNGTTDPESLPSVQKWVSQCFNKPNADEMKMQAINEILEGYGIEAIRTSKWKNGYWCDILCTHINMGDSYFPTIIHHRKHGFIVTCVGNIVEKNKHVI